jgi:hypothetical protein
MLGDFLVGFALLAELEDGFFHFVEGRNPLEGANRGGDHGGRGFTAFPDDTGLDFIGGDAVDDHFVDETAQEGFLSRSGKEFFLVPN